MQDVQSSINGGGVVAGKVLLRRLSHHQPPQQQQPQQLAAINNTYLNHPLSQEQQQQQQQVALKCPRCDSSNTKFCYYNNYNLSQPRHFCKNCRRYWTKGGVLRNVPVGGGCRKSKRSSKPKSPTSSHSTTTSAAATTAAVCSSTGGGGGRRNSVYSQDPGINSSHSSSESSAAVGGGCGGGGGGLFQIPEMDNLETLVDSSSNNTNLFSGEDIGNYMSLNIKCDNMIDNNNNDNINVNDNENGNSTIVRGAVAEAASFSEFLQNQEWEMGKIICGVHHHEERDKIIGGSTAIDLVDVVDPTVRIEDFLQNRGSNVGISTLDWHLTVGNNQGLFDDVAGNSTVEHRDYWSQSTTAVHHHHHDPQWSDSTIGHLPLFLP